MKERKENFSNGIFLKKIKKSRGQVWIETVIYTLIAFVMIGLVLSYARPKIQEIQDQAIIKQSTDMMKQIDETIMNIGAPGNQRVLELGIKEGTLNIDGETDRIFFQLDSKNMYSDVGSDGKGVDIKDGDIIVHTQKKSGYYNVTLTTDYSKNYDIRFQGDDILKGLSKASNPYKVLILNSGVGTDSRTVLDISLN